MSRRLIAAAALTLLLAVPGCTTDGQPSGKPSTPAAASNGPAAAPTGEPVGTAMILVSPTKPVTIRYRINGGPEQTEANVSSVWTKDYPVYPKVEITVKVEGEALCSINFTGGLVSFQPGPNPTCSYAHYG